MDFADATDFDIGLLEEYERNIRRDVQRAIEDHNYELLKASEVRAKSIFREYLSYSDSYNLWAHYVLHCVEMLIGEAD